jgi:hypothetical protein
VFSLSLCAVSALFFYIYENARSMQSTPLGGLSGRVAIMLMNASMDVPEELYILANLRHLADPASNSQLFDQRHIRLGRRPFWFLQFHELSSDTVAIFWG